MLELNSSFLWIFFLIWALYLILNRVFFRPIGRVIDQREAKIAEDIGRQERMMSETETRTRSVDEQLGLARKEAGQIKEEWLKDGEEIRSRSIAEARERAARILDEKTRQLESEIAAAERTLETQIAAFSEKIRQAYL